MNKRMNIIINFILNLNNNFLSLSQNFYNFFLVKYNWGYMSEIVLNLDIYL